MDLSYITKENNEKLKIIELETISETLIKTYLDSDQEIVLLVEEYLIDDIEMPFANLIIGKDSNISEVFGTLYADLLFDYEFFRDFEKYGENVIREKKKFIKIRVSVQKEDILLATVK